jgi:cobalt-zinc-cadmium efflux system outer membrane protein
MRTRLVPAAAGVALCVQAGCASTSPKEAFRDTAALVEARTGHKVVWDQAGDDDAAVAKRLRALLLRELTVDSAVQIALLSNKTLQATYEDLSVAQADLVQAGLLQNPVFSAGIALPVSGDVRTGLGLSVSQDFLSVFLLAARRRVAEADLRVTTLRVGDTVLRTAFEVESAFYDLAGAQQVAAMRRSILEAEDAAVDLSRRQHDAGNISDLDLANQQALYEQLRTDVVRGDADVVAAREKLTRLLGLWGADAAFRVGGQLPELPKDEVGLEHLESVAVERRLDLAAAREDTRAAWRRLAMAKNYRFLGTTAAGATFERAPEAYTTVGPNVSLELPIFDQKQAMVARLEARLRAALAREASLGVDVRSEVRLARSRVVAMRAVVNRYATVVVPLRQQVVALSQQQFDAMLIGPNQLLLAKQNEVNAYRELIEALRDYWVARADLERASGGIVPMAPPVPDSPSQPGAPS